MSYTTGRPDVDVAVTDVHFRDRVRWGPIVAGVVTGFAILLFLTVIGAALGLSALGGDNDTSSWGTTAGIYGGLSLLIAFFAGGYMAARSASPTPEWRASWPRCPELCGHRVPPSWHGRVAASPE